VGSQQAARLPRRLELSSALMVDPTETEVALSRKVIALQIHSTTLGRRSSRSGLCTISTLGQNLGSNQILVGELLKGKWPVELLGCLQMPSPVEALGELEK